MIWALFHKGFRDARWLLLGLGVLMCALPWLDIYVASKFNLPVIAEVLTKSVPKTWQRISGVSFDEMATISGRIAVALIHPVMLFCSATWAIARGSDVVAGEIGRGTMELLLAQPIRRAGVYAVHAAITTLGAAMLAAATWAGIALGIGTVSLPEAVAPSLYVPPALNLFALMFFLGGAAALVSACRSQRSHVIGIMAGWYLLSLLIDVLGRAFNDWSLLRYASFLRFYMPQSMVARPQEAWLLIERHPGEAATLGMGGGVLVLMTLGLLFYLAGGLIFARREIPAPL